MSLAVLLLGIDGLQVGWVDSQALRSWTFSMMPMKSILHRIDFIGIKMKGEQFLTVIVT